MAYWGGFSEASLVSTETSTEPSAETSTETSMAVGSGLPCFPFLP